jgi:hypothetical protein
MHVCTKNPVTQETEKVDLCFLSCELPFHHIVLILTSAIVYTLRVHDLGHHNTAVSPKALSMVHHITASGGRLVCGKNNEKKNKEQIFGLISGFKIQQIAQLLTGITESTRDLEKCEYNTQFTYLVMTPWRLVTAALYQYCSFVGPFIANMKDENVDLNKQIKDRLTELDQLTPETHKVMAEGIRKINIDLVRMNEDLIGTRTAMHNLTDSAKFLIKDLSRFEEYVLANVEEWCGEEIRDNMRGDLNLLDSFKRLIPDRNELVLVKKNIQQYQVDIECRQRHIDHSFGMVSRERIDGKCTGPNE